MVKCLNCQNGKAQMVPPYGYLPCKKCTKKQKAIKVKETIEITTLDIKESRKQYRDDILQRYKASTPSLEYIKKYGTKGFTQEEIKNARNVGVDYYSDKTEKL